MKKILLIMSMVIVLFGITACDDNSNDDKKDTVKEEDLTGLQDWPRDTFFDNLPSLTDQVAITKSESDKGLRYVLSARDISYNTFRKWVYELEGLGYHYQYVDQMLPENEDNLIKEMVSWSTEELINDIYITASYYSKVEYESKANVIIVILNYDPLL